MIVVIVVIVALGAALVAGMILGMLGAGGALLIAPALVGAAGVDPHQAIAVSLIVVAATSPVAAWLHHRRHRLRVRTGLSFAAASVPASFAGAWLAGGVPGEILMRVFAAAMVVAAVAVVARRGEPVPRPRAPWAVPVIGAIVGLATGAVGVGGGFAIVPALVVFAGVPVRDAIGSSLVVIALNALAGVAGALGAAPIDGTLAASLAAVAILGTFAGAAVAPRISVPVLRLAFAVLLLGVAAWIVLHSP